MNNIIVAQLSGILNRLAGSADEAGSFMQFLKEQLENQTQEYQKAIVERDKLELEFKEAIQKLQISEQEKTELEERLESLSGASKRKSYVEQFFPNLSNSLYSVIGPATVEYNSFAWGAGDTEHRWGLLVEVTIGRPVFRVNGALTASLRHLGLLVISRAIPPSLSLDLRQLQSILIQLEHRRTLQGRSLLGHGRASWGT